MKLWLTVAYLLSAQQEYNRKQQKHGSHVVYVIEHTDQFQKFGKTVARSYELNLIIYFLNHDFFQPWQLNATTVQQKTLPQKKNKQQKADQKLEQLVFLVAKHAEFEN